MTVDQAVAKALSLIEARDYVSFAELGREIPGFDAEKDDGGYVIGVGDAVWWLATKVRLGSLCRAHRAACRYPAHTTTPNRNGWRLCGALSHNEHPRLGSSPLWSEALDESRRRKRSRKWSSRPGRSHRGIARPKASALKRLCRAQHITRWYDVSGGDITGLARVVLVGEYAARLIAAGRCRLCHFSIEDAIDPAPSAIW